MKIVNPAETVSSGVVIDFDKVIENAPLHIVGTAADLVRDSHDNPARWVHNSQALPDDRKPAFLVGRGWSASEIRLWEINGSGIPWMAVNNYPEGGPRPRYWCTGDPPGYFGNRIWDDIEVMKFSPMSTKGGARPRIDAYDERKTAVDGKNVNFFHHVNNETELESWLHLPYISWGTSIWGERVPDQYFSGGAARSSMLIGMRLLWHLGYREVYLLGCDCTPGHHPAPMYWPTIFHLIEKLKPTFDRWGFSVYQTNPDSHLRTFPIVPFKEALSRV